MSAGAEDRSTSVATQPARAEADAWLPVRDLPVRLTIDIALPAMSLRAMGALGTGQTLRSAVAASEDLPVVVGGALLGWARFECVDDRMLMRVTRLA